MGLPKGGSGALLVRLRQGRARLGRLAYAEYVRLLLLHLVHELLVVGDEPLDGGDVVGEWFSLQHSQIVLSLGGRRGVRYCPYTL